MSKKNKKILKIVTGMYVFLGLFLIFTNPRDLPMLGLIFPIIWLFLCLTLSSYILLTMIRNSAEADVKRLLIYSAGFSLMVCSIILLRSVNQLNGRDLLLVLLFMIVASFYAIKFRLPVKS